MNNTFKTFTAKKEMRDTVAEEGKRIVDNVRYTDYRHRTEVDEFTGTYIMDCSGFVSYVLERVASVHFAMILKELDQPRPRAFEFYEYFSALMPESDGWRPIRRIAHIRKGDIIAWRHPGPIESHEDTGHVLIVAQTPSVEIEGVYSVIVYDSSDIPHNDDTRQDSVTGVGMGKIKFRADRDDKPTSFQFKVRDLFYSYPIAIGRPETFIEPEKIDQWEVERFEVQLGGTLTLKVQLRETEQLEVQLRETEQLEAQRREAEQLEAQRREAEQLEAQRREAEQLEVQLRETEQLEAQRRETEQLEVQLREAEQLEAQRREAEQLEAQRREAEQLEVQRRETEQLEAQRREAEQLEAQRREAEQLEVQRRETEQLEAQRREAEQLEVQLREAEQLEAQRREKERSDAQQRETAERLKHSNIQAGGRKTSIKKSGNPD